MGWHGHLQLNYRRAVDRTVLHDRHEGPLRVLQRLYPEGPGICHSVLVHPPGGIVGGDVLGLEVTLAPGAHALITTAGATRFYRSAGEIATQRAPWWTLVIQFSCSRNIAATARPLLTSTRQSRKVLSAGAMKRCR